MPHYDDQREALYDAQKMARQADAALSPAVRQRPAITGLPIPRGHPDFKLRVGDIVLLEGGVTTMITAMHAGLFGAPSEAGWLKWDASGKGLVDGRDARGRTVSTQDIRGITGGIGR